jgi:hypothetical protein
VANVMAVGLEMSAWSLSLFCSRTRPWPVFRVGSDKYSKPAEADERLTRSLHCRHDLRPNELCIWALLLTRD